MRDEPTDDGMSENKQRLWDDFDPDDGEPSVEHDLREEGTDPEADTRPPTPPEIPGTDSEETPPTPSQRDIEDFQPLYRARSTEFYLMWLVAVLAYGVGDTLTTGVILLVPTLDESNPLVEIILGQFGLAGFVGVKLAVFAVLIYVSVKGALDGDTVSYYAAPSLAILLGTALTLWNLATILGL